MKPKILGLISLINILLAGSAWSVPLNLTGSITNNHYGFEYTLGTSTNADPGIGFTLGFEGPVSYNYDIPLPNVSFNTISISQAKLLANQTAKGYGDAGFVSLVTSGGPSNVSFSSNLSFNTGFFAQWSGYDGLGNCSTAGTLLGLCLIPPVPGFDYNFQIPSFSVYGVTFTASGSSTLNSLPGQVGQTGALWNSTGDQIEFLANANIPYVSAAAGVMSAADFYLNANFGIGIQEVSDAPLIGSLLDGPTWADLTDTSLGWHTIDVTTDANFAYDFMTDFLMYGVNSLTFGNSSSIWGFGPETLYSLDFGGWDVGTLHTPRFLTVPLTYTVSYQVVENIPEPGDLSLFAIGLAAAALSRQKLQKRSGTPSPRI